MITNTCLTGGNLPEPLPALPLPPSPPPLSPALSLRAPPRPPPPDPFPPAVCEAPASLPPCEPLPLDPASEGSSVASEAPPDGVGVDVVAGGLCVAEASEAAGNTSLSCGRAEAERVLAGCEETRPTSTPKPRKATTSNTQTHGWGSLRSSLVGSRRASFARASLTG